MKKAQFISLIVLIAVGIGSTHYVLSEVPKKVTQSMLEIEYAKVGWKINYEKINEIQKKQIIAGLEAFERQNGQVPTEQPQANNDTKKEISLEVAKKVVSENTHVLGNPDAEITWVEYSDLNCPFCKKLHDEGTATKILKEYDWRVNVIFKQYPLHGSLKAEAVLCAWDLWGTDKFYEFKKWVFAWNTGKTKESMAKFWSTIWLDEAKLLSCLETEKNKDLAFAQMKEGQSLFGITWTPWNVFINNKTGEWDKLPWAYPISAFKEKIDSLLQK